MLRVPILQPTDALQCIIDKVSLEYLTSSSSLSALIRDPPFPIQWILAQSPKNTQEGFLLRYKIPLTYTQDILFYSDIDIVYVRPIADLVSTMTPNTMYVHPEAPLKSSPYYNHPFSKEKLANYSDRSAGFSAGKFAIYGKDLAKYILSAVRVLIYQSPKYDQENVGDQPYFNLAIYTYLIDVPTAYNLNLNYFTRKTIATNGYGFSEDTYCIDCMGEDSQEGGVHWKKVLNYYTLLLRGRPLA